VECITVHITDNVSVCDGVEFVCHHPWRQGNGRNCVVLFNLWCCGSCVGNCDVRTREVIIMKYIKFTKKGGDIHEYS